MADSLKWSFQSYYDFDWNQVFVMLFYSSFSAFIKNSTWENNHDVLKYFKTMSVED